MGAMTIDDLLNSGTHHSLPLAVSTPSPFPPDHAEIHGAAVGLQATVDVDGNIKDLKISRPVGLGFDEKALEAVSRWKFKPATQAGKPVPVIIDIEAHFW